MISINHMPNWGFGNRILYYHNLRQLSEKYAEVWSCIPWDGHEHFVGDMLGERSHGGMDLKPCLGELFFEVHVISTRDIFRLKMPVTVPEKTVAVHFRGTDFFQWNPDAVLEEEYYLNAIELLKNEVNHFVIFTDDESLPSYNKVRNYLNDHNISYDRGENDLDRSMYIDDFNKMCACDYIISSPSTYCICAGFIGKEKKIIHSEKWLKDRLDAEDKFWFDLNGGGNKDYSIWRLV